MRRRVPEAFARLVSICRTRARFRTAAACARMELEARREASLIVAAARAKGDAMITEAETLQASLAAAVVAAQQTLTRINGHIAEATQTYRRLEAQRLGAETAVGARSEPRAVM
jgi:hypothetical protein